MTASTRVRPWRTEDADALAAAVRASLPELMRWLPWCHRDYDRRDAEHPTSARPPQISGRFA